MDPGLRLDDDFIGYAFYISYVFVIFVPSWFDRRREMTDYSGFKEIGVSLDGLVATVEMRRPPHNFFDSDLIAEIGQCMLADRHRLRRRRKPSPGYCRAPPR